MGRSQKSLIVQFIKIMLRLPPADVPLPPHDRAIADLSEAIRLDPKSAAAYGNRAAAYRIKGENDRALSPSSTTASAKAMCSCATTSPCR